MKNCGGRIVYETEAEWRRHLAEREWNKEVDAMPVDKPLELIIVAYLDMDTDEIIRDPVEAKRRDDAGKRIKALFRFPGPSEFSEPEKH